MSPTEDSPVLYRWTLCQYLFEKFISFLHCCVIPKEKKIFPGAVGIRLLSTRSSLTAQSIGPECRWGYNRVAEGLEQR